MTCVVGTVTKDGWVIMGADSGSFNGYSVTMMTQPKVFQVGEFLVGSAGFTRTGGIIRHKFRPPDHDPRLSSDDYLNGVWLDELMKVIEASGKMYAENGLKNFYNDVLIGYRSRLFSIGCDGAVVESMIPYNAVGCGEDLAKGAMHALQGSKLSPEQQIQKALEAAAVHNAGVRPPFMMMKQPPPKKATKR